MSINAVVLNRDGDTLRVVEAPALAYFSDNIIRDGEIERDGNVLRILATPPVQYVIVGSSVLYQSTTWIAERV